MPVGEIAATAILDNNQVAPLGIPGWMRIAEVRQCSLLVVGMATQQDGMRPLLLGAIYVRQEDCPIAHGGRNIPLYRHATHPNQDLVTHVSSSPGGFTELAFWTLNTSRWLFVPEVASTSRNICSACFFPNSLQEPLKISSGSRRRTFTDRFGCSLRR